MANNNWILDVLADLRTFAVANGLEGLAEQLEDTTLIAAAEIGSGGEEARKRGTASIGRSGPDTGRFGRHGHA